MKNKFFLFFAAILFVSVIVGCKSTPPAEPEPEVTPAPVQPETVTPAPAAEPKPVDDALTALRDNMEEIRNLGLKYELDTYKQDTWQEAEAVRETGMNAYGSDYDLAQKSFKDATARYQKILNDAFAEVAPEIENDIIKARQETIDAGADSYAPEQFALADEAKDKAADLRDKRDLPGAYDTAQIALMRYQALTKSMEVVDLIKQIETNNFAQYDEDDYDLAGAKCQEAIDAYGSDDSKALKTVTEVANLYGKVVAAGFKVWTEEQLVKTNEIRSLCDSIKARKSMAPDYAKAADLYTTAADHATKEEWEAAYIGYVDSATAFTNVYQAALLKRNAAEAAMASAKARQDSSSELAAQADVQAPLPEAAEDSPTVQDETESGEEVK